MTNHPALASDVQHVEAVNQVAATALRSAGRAVVAGALVFSLVPARAWAKDSTASPQAESAAVQDSTSGQQPPDLPTGENRLPSSAVQGQPGTPPTGSGANTQSFDYTGSYEGVIAVDGTKSDASNTAASANDTGQNAVLVQNGGTLNITNSVIDKSGDNTSSDACNFYGVNSILLSVGEGSTAKVSDSTLSSTSEGSNGIFSTDRATVYANGVVIRTAADNARGLDATYGGTILGNDVQAATEGDHCAGAATDRGGGSVSLTNSTLNTEGSGSPLLYSTGDIEVNNVSGKATGSQIAGMEGLNTILINNSTLESTQTEKTASDPIADGVIIYQSTSGDADTGTGEAATFQAANSTLKSAITSGSMFYFTNTTANVVLSNTTLDFNSSAANLIEAAGNDSNGWGTAGSNGANVTFTGRNEIMNGNVDADTISDVDLYLLDNSAWTGAASISQNAYGSTSDAPLTVNVDDGSAWIVTADSTVTNLNVAEGGQVVDGEGRTVSIVEKGTTVVQGDSDYTVTVNGAYTTGVDDFAAGSLSNDLVDRSGFDSEYGTTTSYSMGDTAQADDTSTTPTDANTSANGLNTGFWDRIVEFFRKLFL